MKSTYSKDKKAFEFIKAYRKQFGYYPTLLEIAKELGVKHKASAALVVKRLVKAGWVYRPKGTARTFIIKEEQ